MLVENLGLWRPTLRIVAPHAPQRTALQEYRGTNSRAVVDGVAFDVEDEWIQLSIFNYQCSILFVLRPCDDFVLELLGHVVEVVAIASHADE